jgi:tetratricopeptide (TPR) repeat protein
MTTTVALAVFVFVLSGKQRETQAQRRAADRARDEAKLIAADAEQKRALAMATLRDVVEDNRLAVGDGHDQAEGVEERRAKLIDNAIARLEQLRGPREAEEALARAYLKRGGLALARRNHQLAGEKFEQARQVLLPLTEAEPKEAGLRQELWQALIGLGDVELAKNRPREAQALFAEAVRVARALAESPDDLLGGLRRLRESLMRLGLSYQKAAQLADAGGAYHEGAETAARLMKYNAPGGKRDRALSLARLGEVRLKQDDPTVAIKLLREAEDLFAAVPPQERTAAVMQEWATIYDRLAEAHGRRGETELAGKAADNAALLRKRMKRDKGPP